MSESKHTPGPWVVDEDTRPGMEWNRHIYGPDGNAVCFMAHSDGKAVERDEANARLIARAPDLAAEVERLREERDASEKMMRAAYENACAHRAAAAERFAAERRKVEALEAEIALRRKSGSAVDRLHNLCEGIAESADGSEWSREEWERIDAENAALRRKVEALRTASAGSRGWLVEWRYHSSVQWLYLWSVAGGGFSFTADASKALRLARREDAEAVLEWARDTDSKRGLHSGQWLVTEHVWESTSAALASTEGGAK